ncbi:hypothetical protein GCM10023185_23190 [Hymenobacter saemangeumensis]|uniref:Carboxypeptidase regulatory-like domain-containing protein n=1 Tax=Hymenobacter saemangeumensis TaxID=1084522 RepID=A0ABP8IFT5_9BACT
MNFLRLNRSSSFLACFSLFFALLTSCSKDSAAPTVGKITGTIVPAAAVASILAEGPDGSSTTVSPNTDNGEFSIANLKAGSYVLRFSAATGYTNPADRNVSVAAGETNNVGTIRATAFVIGSVEGSCSPANGLRAIVLSEPGTQGGPIVYPDVNGYFRFPNVAPGTYNVSFDANSGFQQPAPRTITVSGGTSSLGVIAVTPTGPTSRPLSGTVRWTTNGTGYSSTSLTGNMFLNNGAPSSFSLSATSLNGTVADLLGLSSGCTAPGVYYLSTTTSNTGTYLRTYGGVPGPSYETRNRNGTNGTVTITAIDATARTLSGTFGFVAYEPPLATGSVTVSNGSFTLSY